MPRNRRAMPTMALMLTMTLAAMPAAASVFINELHYDNAGSDSGEFIEIAGPAGVDVSGWSIALYNGASSQLSVYDTVDLGGVLPDQCGGFGTLSFPRAGIQNGSPDGLALVDNAGNVIQFLSYEGTMTATSGPAAGLTSIDLGIAEDSTTQIGESLQLTGSGTQATDFTWAGPLADSPGSCNADQTFAAGDLPLRVSRTEPSNGALAVAPSADIVIEFSEPVAVTDPWVTLSCNGQSVDVGVTGGPASYTLTPAADLSGSTACTVTIDAARVADLDGAPDGLEADFTFSFTTQSVCGDPATRISTIQGQTQESPLAGSVRTIEGIVVGDYQQSDELNGFFVQEEDADADGNPLTSEGIFVFEGSSTVAVSEGDRVRVTGTVTEFFGLTELTDVSQVLNCGQGGIVTPAELTLPAPGPVNDADTFEAYEGMLVRFAEPLTVTEFFQLGRFGQVVLSRGERQTQFTANNPPSIDGFAAHQAEIGRNRIILDDLNNRQNADPVYHPQPDGFAVDNGFRGGDTVTGLTGVMHWSWAGAGGTDAWRIRPQVSRDVIFDQVNPREEQPEDTGGRLEVASFNVLNYFTTLDTGTPACGPDTTLDCRGAHSEAELIRQTDKIVAALVAIDADIVGLIELENNETQSLQVLVDALNATLGSDAYAYVDTGTIGSDAIKVGYIYKPSTTVPVGDFVILDSSVDPAFIDTRSRPALIQTFEETATGERFTLALNHLKSKGSACDDLGDPDVGDGQGNCNLTRASAAQALVDYLATDPTGSGDPDVLILGDLNAYTREDPIAAIEAAGYVNLVERLVGSEAYSFVFDGQWGYLDHALATPNLDSQVTGVTVWHINADEVSLLDYNDTVVDAAEASFEAKPLFNPLYAPDPFRSSDHDPIVIGLELGAPAAPTCRGLPATVYVDGDGYIVGGRYDGRRYGGFLIGTQRDDVIVGTQRGDLIIALAGNDVVCGRGGPDLILGGNGRDQLFGQGGRDLLFGESGRDYLDGGQGKDALDGGNGRDTCVAGEFPVVRCEVVH